MQKNNYYTIYALIYLQFILFSCKDSNLINLESAIDEYLYLEKTEYNNPQFEKVKSKFELINPNKLNLTHQISRLYYLSEIALMQNKPREAKHFIEQAYQLNHADSIYMQKEKINSFIKKTMACISFQSLKYLLLTKTKLSRGKKWNKKFAKEYIQEIRLLSLKEMKYLFPNSKNKTERFLGMSKSYTLHNLTI